MTSHTKGTKTEGGSEQSGDRNICTAERWTRAYSRMQNIAYGTDEILILYCLAHDLNLPVRVRFVVNRAALGQVFLPVHRCSPVSIILPAFQTDSVIYHRRHIISEPRASLNNPTMITSRSMGWQAHSAHRMHRTLLS